MRMSDPSQINMYSVPLSSDSDSVMEPPKDDSGRFVKKSYSDPEEERKAAAHAVEARRSRLLTHIVKSMKKLGDSEIQDFLFVCKCPKHYKVVGSGVLFENFKSNKPLLPFEKRKFDIITTAVPKDSPPVPMVPPARVDFVPECAVPLQELAEEAVNPLLSPGRPSDSNVADAAVIVPHVLGLPHDGAAQANNATPLVATRATASPLPTTPPPARVTQTAPSPTPAGSLATRPKVSLTLTISNQGTVSCTKPSHTSMPSTKTRKKRKHCVQCDIGWKDDERQEWVACDRCAFYCCDKCAGTSDKSKEEIDKMNFFCSEWCKRKGKKR